MAKNIKIQENRKYFFLKRHQFLHMNPHRAYLNWKEFLKSLRSFLKVLYIIIYWTSPYWTPENIRGLCCLTAICISSLFPSVKSTLLLPTFMLSRRKRSNTGDCHNHKSRASTSKSACSSINFSTQLSGQAFWSWPAAVTCVCVQLVTCTWGLISLVVNKVTPM